MVKPPTPGQAGTTKLAEAKAKEGVKGLRARMPSVSRRPFEVEFGARHGEALAPGDVVRVIKEGSQKGRVGVVHELWDNGTAGQDAATDGRLKVKFKRSRRDGPPTHDSADVIKTYFPSELARTSRSNLELQDDRSEAAAAEVSRQPKMTEMCTGTDAGLTRPGSELNESHCSLPAPVF